MPHKQYNKFAVRTITENGHGSLNNSLEVVYYPLGVNVELIAEQVGEPIAEYANNESGRAIAEGTCRLLNQAYSSGHARGMEYVKESLIQAMGFEE